MSYIEPSANVTQVVTTAGGASSTDADLNSVIIGPAFNVVHAGTARSLVEQIAAITDPNAPVEYRSSAGGFTFEDHIPQSTTAQGETDPEPGHFQFVIPATFAGQEYQNGEFELTMVNAQVRQNVVVATGVDPDVLSTIPGNVVDQSGLLNNPLAGFLPLTVQGQPIPMTSSWIEANPATQVDPVFTRNSGSVTQLGLSDRGTYNASGNAYPTTGGSGLAGAIKTGDYWRVTVQGTVAPFTVAVSLIALVDNPGSTDANWETITVVAKGSDYRGVFDATANTYPLAGSGSGIDYGGNISIRAGDCWKIHPQGTVAPFDTAKGLIALVDNPGSTAANWEATTWDPSLKYAYALDANGYDGAPSTLVGDIVKYSALYAKAKVNVTLKVSTTPTAEGFSGTVNDRGNFDAGAQDGYPTSGGSGLGGAIVAGDFFNVINATSLSPLYGKGGVYALVNGASQPDQWATTSIGLINGPHAYDLNAPGNTGFPAAGQGSGVGGAIVAGDWFTVVNDGPSHSAHPLHGATVAIAKVNAPGQTASKWILLTIAVSARGSFDAGLAINSDYPHTGGSGVGGAVQAGDYYHVINAEPGSPLENVTGLIALASPPTGSAGWAVAAETITGIEVTAVALDGSFTIDAAPRTYTTALRDAQKSESGIWTLQTSGRLLPDAYQVLTTPGTPASLDYTQGAHSYVLTNGYTVYNALPAHFNPAAVENRMVDFDIYRVHPTLSIPLDQTPSDENMPWIYFQDEHGVIQREADVYTNPADGQNKLTLSSNFLDTVHAQDLGYVTLPANFKSAPRSGSNGVTVLYGEINQLPLPSDWNLSVVRFAEAIFLGYRALRTDLADQLLSVGSLAEVASTIGEQTPDNPLGLGLMMALAASGGVPIKAYATVGNTLKAHMGAMEYLERRDDIHCMAPLTRDIATITSYGTHIAVMSTNLENAWRTGVFNIAHPTKQFLSGGDRVDTLAAASLYQIATPNGVGVPQYNSTSYVTHLIDTTKDFLAAGVKAGDLVVIPNFRVDGAQTLPSGTHASSFIGSWQVDSLVDSHTLVLKPIGGTYPKAYYQDTNNRPTNVVPQSSSSFIPYYCFREATKDYVVQYLKSISTTLKTRRIVHAQPDVIEIQVAGTPTLVDGTYFAAEHAGILAGSRPQQNFTRMATAAITDLRHSNLYFSRAQMRDMASAGIMFAVQKVPQGIPFISHALTTDVTALFYQEQMKTRNLDFLSYTFLRLLDPFVGKWNITPGLFTAARTLIMGKAAQLKAQSVDQIGAPLLDLKIVTLAQSTLNADRVTCHLRVAIVDPANYIDIILEV